MTDFNVRATLIANSWVIFESSCIFSKFKNDAVSNGALPQCCVITGFIYLVQICNKRFRKLVGLSKSLIMLHTSLLRIWYLGGFSISLWWYSSNLRSPPPESGMGNKTWFITCPTAWKNVLPWDTPLHRCSTEIIRQLSHFQIQRLQYLVFRKSCVSDNSTTTELNEVSAFGAAGPIPAEGCCHCSVDMV